jgi:amino acid permease
MHSRKLQAILSCVIFLAIAKLYEVLANEAVSTPHVLLWSGVGVLCYIALSHIFGFDPHRTKLAQFASPLLHYVDRWELRLGQATLAMLGCVVLAARFIDNENFVTAVVSGTLAAWTYFALRLYTGGYKATAHGAR